MLLEKNTLFGLSVLWFTGCSAVSPGHLPFWARASISVPGAPASSLLTGSQLLVLNPGVEICAPVWVATALLWTSQPDAPRSDTSVALGTLAAASLAVAAARAAGGGVAWAVAATTAGTATRTAAPAARMKRNGAGLLCILIAGDSRRSIWDRAVGRTLDPLLSS